MQTDLELLQGTWRVDSVEIDGAGISSAVFAGAQLIIDGERFVSLSMGAVYEGILQLDPEQKPKSLVMVFTKGPEHGHTNHGIYEVAPKGWRLCLNIVGGPRPAAFSTSPGSGHALETLVRKLDQ